MSEITAEERATIAETTAANLHAEIARLTRCPVCGETDPDGLEACSKCYSFHFSRSARAETAEAALGELIDAYDAWDAWNDSDTYLGDELTGEINARCDRAEADARMVLARLDRAVGGEARDED